MRADLFTSINRAWISEEEKTICIFVLEYLLRTDNFSKQVNERNDKVEIFFKKFPNSKYKNFLYKNCYDRTITQPSGFSGHLYFGLARNNGKFGINFNPQFNFGLGLGQQVGTRWGWLIGTDFGFQKIKRSFLDNKTQFAKDSSFTTILLQPELFFRAFSSGKLSFLPFVGLGGAALFGSNSIGDDEFFVSYFGLIGTHLDWKIAENGNEYNATNIRINVGFRFQNYGGKHPELGGNQIFIGAGISGFSQKTSKKKL